MKKFIISSIMVTLLSAGLALKAQSREEYLGLPGDNLNLYAVMQLFQNSKTLEEFERNLNDPNSNINNLDLNGDNMVDYIKVIDEVDGNVHNIVLQVPVSRRENQDVAVFTVQRFNNGQVMVQLTGDEALYGRNYIIEPIADEIPNPGYNGTYERTTTAQISLWPLVRFIYTPTYVVWRSNWYWGYYPNYWRPWSPFSWNYYYGYHSHWNDYYYGHYHYTDQHYYTRYDDYYYRNHRSYSSEVNHNIKKGNYRATYSHPEQRSQGEALFATKYPERYKSSVNNGNSRRSDNNGSYNRSSDNINNSGTSRRSDNNGSYNRSSDISTNPGNSRVSDNNALNNRSSDNPKSIGNSGYSKSSRRQSNIDLNKASDKSFGNSRNARRSESNVNSQNVQRQSAPSQNVQTKRSQSSAASATPSNSRTNSESSTKRERRKTESKEKDSNNSERR